MAYFIRVALVNRLQHLQNLHIVARRTHQRVVVVRLMRHRLRVNVVIIELLTGVLHALRGQQGFCGPWDILMAQAGLEMEVMLADKVVTINIKPVTCRNFRESGACLSQTWPGSTSVEGRRSSGKIGWLSRRFSYT